MLKTFIVEDEPQAITLLETYIGRVPFLSLCGTSRDPIRAFTYLQENRVDLLLLDINMPNLSGLELYKSLSSPPAVIFTTAYPDFAVQGFELEAVDYLLKPITFPRFLKACDRVKKRQQPSSPQTISSPVIADIIYIKSGPTLHKLSWKDILYLEKDENYLVYHTAETRILSRQTLSDLEDIFPDYFARIHKSFAVSLLHVEKVEREQVCIYGRQLPVGRTYRTELLERLEVFPIQGR